MEKLESQMSKLLAINKLNQCKQEMISCLEIISPYLIWVNDCYWNSEYYPQNIMQDRRVARGSTYAAMVIPAGTNPEAMMTKQTNT